MGRTQPPRRYSFCSCGTRLRGFVSALLWDRDAAEDVLQQTFLTLSAKADEFQAGSNFLAWARATARLKELEHLRRDRRRPAGLDEATINALADTATELDDHWEERRAALRAGVERLAPRARELVRLRYSDPEPGAEEIANRVGWTVAAVRVALSRQQFPVRAISAWNGCF